LTKAPPPPRRCCSRPGDGARQGRARPSPDLSAARLGRTRRGGDLAEHARRGCATFAARHELASLAGASASPISAKPSWSSSAAPAAAAPRHRLAMPARRRFCRALSRRARTKTSGARPGSRWTPIFPPPNCTGWCASGPDLAQAASRRGPDRHDGHLPDLSPDRRARVCHRPDQRQPHLAV
jgi:hypothetical protein